jgi:hypothetical protein
MDETTEGSYVERRQNDIVQSNSAKRMKLYAKYQHTRQPNYSFKTWEFAV